jgi:hypothetical protein
MLVVQFIGAPSYHLHKNPFRAVFSDCETRRFGKPIEKLFERFFAGKRQANFCKT